MSETESTIKGCCVCKNFQIWLMNHPKICSLIGWCVYTPLLVILTLIWMIQLIIMIIINIIVYILCCNCMLCNKCRYVMNKHIKWDDMDGVLLSTKKVSNNDNKSDINDDNDSLLANNIDNVSILTYNVFNIFGLYWERLPMLIDVFNETNPDIICIQEGIISYLWSFGTANTIRKYVNKTYNYFQINTLEAMAVNFPYSLGFRYAYLSDFIIELKLALNVYFKIPFMGAKFWTYMAWTGMVWRYLTSIYTGFPGYFGNIILFKNNDMYYKSFNSMPGSRMILRSMYITPINNIKIWIYTTHFTWTDGEQDTFGGRDLRVDQLNELLSFIKNGNETISESDIIFICGDFNLKPTNKIYNDIINNGFKSIVHTKHSKELYTLTAPTFTVDPMLLQESKTYDYIFYKIYNKNIKLTINDAKIVGKSSKLINNDKYTICPSDHFGIYTNISLIRQKAEI